MSSDRGDRTKRILDVSKLGATRSLVFAIGANHRVRVFSMRRSGISHMTATRVYNMQANHELTKESPIARA
ncbi:MAG: hypothetical protein ACR2LR_26900 [Hassallia sp.]